MGIIAIFLLTRLPWLTGLIYDLAPKPRPDLPTQAIEMCRHFAALNLATLDNQVDCNFPSRETVAQSSHHLFVVVGYCSVAKSTPHTASENAGYGYVCNVSTGKSSQDIWKLEFLNWE